MSTPISGAISRPRGRQPVAYRNPLGLTCHGGEIADHPPVVRFMEDVKAHRPYARMHGYEDTATVIAWLCTEPVAAHLAAGGYLRVEDVHAQLTCRFVPEWPEDRIRMALAGCVSLGALRHRMSVWAGSWPLKAMSRLNGAATNMLAGMGVPDLVGHKADAIVALAIRLRATMPEPKPAVTEVIQMVRLVASTASNPPGEPGPKPPKRAPGRPKRTTKPKRLFRP